MTRFVPSNPEPRRVGVPRFSEADLCHWFECMADVPDLRFAKVMRVRRAIATHAYDETHILDRILGTLENDVGILCRRDALLDS